jgi:hypothetical protein
MLCAIGIGRGNGDVAVLGRIRLELRGEKININAIANRLRSNCERAGSTRLIA